MRLQPVILCGGSGTRLWPASREDHPKQLLSLLGGNSLLQSTLHRLDGFGAAEVLPALVVGNERYRFLLDDQLHGSGLARPTLLLEPAGRNTAPALTLAALTASAEGIDPLLLVMPADHVIADEDAFRAAVAKGVAAAERGDFVTFGVVPVSAETGYGYLRRGASYTDLPDAFALEAFVEKPDAATAKMYLEDGSYLWNSGIFLMRASVWLAAIAKLEPAMSEACRSATAALRTDGDFMRVDRDALHAGNQRIADEDQIAGDGIGAVGTVVDAEGGRMRRRAVQHPPTVDERVPAFGARHLRVLRLVRLQVEVAAKDRPVGAVDRTDVDRRRNLEVEVTGVHVDRQRAFADLGRRAGDEQPVLEQDA